MNKIIHEFPVKATEEEIYSALTSENELGNWWLKGAKAKAVIGSVATFPLTTAEGFIKMEIIDLIPTKKVTWKCLDHMHQEWIGTIVNFEIFKYKNENVIRFEHSNWKYTNGIYGRVSFYWASLYLRNLKIKLEENH